MKVVISTTIGFESLAIVELRTLGAKGGEVLAGGKLLLEVQSLRDVVFINYMSRLANRVSLLLKEFEVRTDERGLEDIYSALREVDFTPWLDESVKFAVRCTRRGEHTYKSPDVERVAGQAIIDGFLEKKGKRPPVDLEDPDTILRLELLPHGRSFLTVDFTGYEGLHMRGYRVYQHPAPIKTIIAQGLVHLSGWTPERSFIDPMMGGGTIPIEAAMKGLGIPPQYLRKEELLMRRLKPLRDFDFKGFFEEIDSKIRWDLEVEIYGSDRFKKHVEGAIENARVLNLHTKLEFFKLNVRHLSRKIKKVNTIVTNPPYGLRIANPREVIVVYEDFMREAARVLEDDGVVVLLTPRDDIVERVANQYGFKLEVKKLIMYGKLPVFAYRYVRG